jgi:hypothetical protein
MKKIMFALVVIAMVFGMTLPVQAQQQTQGGHTYDIHITSINGSAGSNPSINCYTSPIIVHGNASAINFVGQLKQYNVQVDWGDGIVDDYAVTNFLLSPSGQDFSGTWQGSHDYATQGNYNITAKLYHSQPPGEESSGDVATIATIFVRVLNYIVISPPNASVAAGDSQAYTVEAFDQYDNSLGDVTSSTSFSMSVGAGGSWFANVYTSQNAGTWTVTGEYSGKTDTATLIVIGNPEALAYIVIAPKSATITAGDSQVYTAEAFDQYDNSLGDVTGSTSFSINAGAGGNWSVNEYTSAKAGTWTVTGEYSGKTDTATLIVNTNPEALDHIVIAPKSATITAGDSQAYTAEAFDQYDNSLGDVTGSTSFSISGGAGGNWTANEYTSEKAGTWTVTGEYSGKTDIATLTVIINPEALDHIVIAPKSATITAGDSQAYTAEAFDQFDNSLGDVTYDTTFNVSAGAGGSWAANVYNSQNAGYWTVTGIYNEIFDTATLTVVPLPPPPPPPPPPSILVSITVTPDSASVVIGGTKQFTATGLYSSGSLIDLTELATWSSSDDSIAAVVAGLASGIGIGTTQIIAAAGGLEGSATLSVTAGYPVVSSIEVMPESASIAVEQSQQFTATATYENGSSGDVTSEAIWESDNVSVSTISAGNATGVGVGTTGVTAKYGNATSNTATLSVGPAVVTGITINTGGSVEVSGTKQITAIATYSDGWSKDVTTEVSWSSSDPGIATIDATGLATGIAVGEVTITAALDGASRAVTLNVTSPIIIVIVVAPTNASIHVNSTQQFTATAMYDNGNSADVTAQAIWTSSKENVAIVAAGLASAKAAGTTDIIATLSDVTSNPAALTVAVGVRWSLIGWIIGAVLAAGLIFFFLMRRRRESTLS